MPIMQNTTRVIFWFLCLSVGFVSLRILVTGIELGYPHMLHQLPRAPFFWTHVVFGATALILMPMQVWKRLRVQRPKLHRWVGRTYGLCILIAGIAGLVIAPFAQTGVIAATGFFTLSAIWLYTTGVGVLAARNREYAKHQRWMYRSMALTFAGVTLRLYLGVAMGTGMAFEVAYPVIAWGCWVPNLVLMELWMNRRSVRFA